EICRPYQRALLVATIIRFDRRHRKARELDSARDPLCVQMVVAGKAIHDEKLRTVDMVLQKCRVGRSTRNTDLVPASIDDIAVDTVSLENAAHITNVVQQAPNEKMRVIARCRVP